MKKRFARFYAGIALSVTLLANSLGFVPLTESPAAAYAAAQEDQADQIHYTLTGPDSVTFSWHQGSDLIRYGETEAYGNTVNAVQPDILPFSDSGPWREAKITGLEPGKTYHYSIGDGEDHTFHTAPAVGSSGFTLVTTGDIGSSFNYSSAAGMNQLIKDLNPDLYIGLGDFTYANAHGQEAVTHYFNDVMPWSTGVPFMPIWGNHEWETPQKDDLRNYKGRFDLPYSRTDATAPSLGCCGKDWYFFDYGHTRFIGMPEPFSSTTWTNWAEHAKPIFDQAQSDPDITFIVSFVHRPTWSSGYYDSDKNLQKIVREMAGRYSKYVLNLNGHDHHYERSDPKMTDDIVTIVAGGGGAGLHIYEPSGCKWKICEQPEWSAARYFNYGAVKLDFEENEIKGQFVCGPLEGIGRDDESCEIGDVLDEFVIKPRNNDTQTHAPPGLSDLKMDGKTLSGFDADTTEYTVHVRHFTESVKVTATLLATSDAEVQVVGGDHLEVGNNTITVTMTMQDGTENVYTINVIRDEELIPATEMEGSGTAADPYIVLTAEHLDKIRNNLSAHYKLGADIDLAEYDTGEGKGWMPIGSTDSAAFKGSLDGNGFIIHNLKINRADSDDISYAGLFGIVEGAALRNVWLDNVDITGKKYVGALAALMNGGTDTNSISGSYAAGKVAGIGSGAMTGGLVGDLQHSVIKNSYAIVEVNGDTSNTGGLAGRTSSSAVDGRITNSYAAGKVSTGGGLIGAGGSSQTVQSSYWDTESTTRSTSPKGGTGKTTEQMKQQATFVGWDFDNVWEIEDGSDYPLLRNPRHATLPNAELADLKLNGTTVAGFNPDIEQYTANVLNNVTSASVTATLKADSESKVEVSGAGSLNTGSNTVTVSVYAQDNTQKTYSITVNRDETVKSSFKELSDLKVNGTTFDGFNPGEWYYSMKVPYDTTQLTVDTLTAPGSGAVGSVSVIGGAKLTGNTVSDLQIADNTVKVTVKAEDGTEKIYLLIVTRGKYIPTSEERMDGEGTSDNPYIVKTAVHLNFMRNNIDAHYKLGADIDLTGYSAPDEKGWLPIGISSPESFKGSFDGNGYKIIGMTINRPELDYVGLFGYATSAVFKNIQMIDVNVTGKNQTGGFVGYTGGSGTTDKAYVTGKVTGNNYVGGFSGASQRSPVSNSYADVEVTGNQYVGGLTGNLDYSGSTFGKITNSYAVGKVTGNTSFGGLIGAVLGGPNPGYKVTSSYWDTSTSKQSTSVYGTGKTTAEMMQKATFVDWDFANVWEIDEGKGYPQLKGMNQPSSSKADQIHYTITGPDSVTFSWHGGSDQIKFGLTNAYGQTVTAGVPTNSPFSAEGPWREARLAGLQPGTTYHYSIGGSPDQTFHTAPVAGSSGFTVVTSGDAGSSKNFPAAAPVQQLIASLNPDLYLGLGDFTYADTGGQETVNAHFNDVMAWSLQVPYMPIWGNHEWENPRSDDLRNYKGRFDLPNGQIDPSSPDITKGTPGDWYWFDYGNTRLIAYPEPWSGSAYQNWYDKAVEIMDQANAEPQIKFVVTFGHRPAYSSGNHDSDTSLAKYMELLAKKYPKYVLSLEAHAHHYERTDSSQTFGVQHVVIGTGGSSLEPANTDCKFKNCTPPPWSAERFYHFGALKLDFGAEEITGTFVCGPPSSKESITCGTGEIADTFTIKSRVITPDPAARMDGSGTKEAPYLVRTAQDLYNVRQQLDAHYRLEANIDLTFFDAGDGKGWKPIGVDSNNRFTGIFDGNGFIIQGLTMKRPNADFQSLFGYAGVTSGAQNTATFTNVALEDVAIEGNNYTGALVGYISGNGSITTSYATGTVKGGKYTGGLIGSASIPVSNSYAQVQVTGTENVGGLVGSGKALTNTYSAGKVTGSLSITTVGGLVGVAGDKTVSDSYWDLDISGQSTSSGGGTGKSTADMKKQATYQNWDFESVWQIEEGKAYPLLSNSVPPASTNANLSDIRINGNSVNGFSPSKTNYEINVPYSVASASVTAITMDDKAQVEVSGGGDLKVGDNTVTVTVTAQDKVTKKAYTLKIVRGEALMSGSGTQTDPYRVKTIQDLDQVRNDLHAHYRLEADLNLSGYDTGDGKGWLPIGIDEGEKAFHGVFDGRGHVIDGLTINRPTEYFASLFGYVVSGVIRNIGLTHVDVKGKHYAGGLVSYHEGKGGLIENSYVIGKVSGGTGRRVGALVGETSVDVYNSYAQADVTGSDTVGGLIGRISGGNIVNSYFSGEVSFTASTSINNGPFIGGYSSGTVTHSYWNTDKATQPPNDLGEGRTAEEMKRKATYVDWNFKTVWLLDEGNDFPQLREPALSSNADLSDLKVDGTTVKGFASDKLIYTMNVPNSKTLVAVTYTKADSYASVAMSGGSDLKVGDNKVTVTVTAEDGTTKKIYTITVKRASAIVTEPKPPGGNDTSTSPSEPEKPGDKPEDAHGENPGETSGGQKPDPGAGSGGQPTAGEGIVKLEATVTGNTANAEISAERIQGNDIVVTSPIASFTLPNAAIDTAALEQQLGSGWKLVVRMEVLPEEQQLTIEQRINAVGGSIIGKVVDFTVTAEANGRSVTITQLNGLYASHTITMDAAINSKQATVVRIEKDGSLTFVPAVFNGREVTFYSLSNSNYAVVSVDRNFLDTQGHWAMDNIHVLASKLIVSGTDEHHYSPDQPITRAEFITLIVRSLGHPAGSGSAQFKDVAAADWYAGYIQQAEALGLVSGYGDGTFHPQDAITREQMAIILGKALSLAGKPLSEADVNSSLASFNDRKQISGWAAQEVAAAANAGLLTGLPNGQFQPQAPLTRAQAAAVLLRMLQKANFMN